MVCFVFYLRTVTTETDNSRQRGRHLRRHVHAKPGRRAAHGQRVIRRQSRAEQVG